MYTPPDLSANLTAADKAARVIADKIMVLVDGDEKTDAMTEYECATLYLYLRAKGWHESMARRVQRTQAPTGEEKKT